MFLHLRPGKENKRNQIPHWVYREKDQHMGQHLRTRQRPASRRRVLRAAIVTPDSHDVSPFAFDLLD